MQAMINNQEPHKKSLLTINHIKKQHHILKNKNRRLWLAQAEVKEDGWMYY